MESPGPWLIINNISESSSGDRLNLLSLDGNEWTRMDVPQLSLESRLWRLELSPKGGYIAAQAINRILPMAFDNNEVDGQLWIIKLPENRLIKKIPLLGQEGWKEGEGELSSPLGSTLFGIISDKLSVKWSPNGRYLAFSAALKGTVTNIFLYDIEDQSITQVTDSQKNSEIWSWAPDSKSFLYREITSYDLDYGLQYATFSGVYLQPLIGKGKLLYVPESNEDIIWLDDHSDVLIYKIGIEGYKGDLRELNLKNDAIRTLYKDSFTGLSLFPEPRSILLNLSSNAYNTYDFQSGIYVLNLNTIQKKILIPCAFCWATWDENQHWINLRLYLEDEMGTEFFNQRGKKLGYLKGEASYFYGSLDGRWFILSNSNKYRLFDNLFNPVKEIYGSNILWRPDSTGFFILEDHCQIHEACLSLYSRDNGWNPAYQHNIPSLESELYIIQP